jgi:hypothetical protein
MIHPVDVAHAIRFYTEILKFKIAFQYEDAIAWLNFGQYRDDVKGPRSFCDKPADEVSCLLRRHWTRSTAFSWL